MKNNKNKIVLQKFIVDSGYCSRRQATDIIKTGRIKINGEIAELGAKVFPDDDIRIGENKIKCQANKTYIILNKPKGYVCTKREFKGEKNIFELVRVPERLFAVGRLDKDSRGLVLLTNDGALTEKLTHPRYEHEKEYYVQISNSKFKISNEFINDIILKLKKGIKIEGGLAKIKKGKYLGNRKFKIVLTQGIKRQIRLMFKTFGLDVVDLERTRINNIKLEDLKEGEWRKLKNNEIEKLK